MKKTFCLTLACIMLAGLLAAPALAAPKPPVAVPQTVIVARTATIDITLEGKDADGNALSSPVFTIGTEPKLGDLTYASGNKYKYTPYDKSKTGTDTFTFRVSAAGVASAPATVTIQIVEPVPIARDSAIDVVPGNSKAGTVDAYDPSGLDLTFEVVAGPKKGTLEGTDPKITDKTGAFTYKANADATGTDSFTYIARNTQNRTSGVATVTVNFVSSRPTANPQTLTVPLNSTGKAGTLTGTDPVSGTTGLSFFVALQPLHGTLTPDVDFLTSGKFTYKPDKDYLGDDRFFFTVKNAGGDESAQARVSISVVSPKPTAKAITVEAKRNKPVSIQLEGTDPNNEDLTYKIEVDPKYGSTSGLKADAGTVTFTPKKNMLGKDEFYYSVTNTSGLKSETAKVTVDVVVEEVTSTAYVDMANHWAKLQAGQLGGLGMVIGERIQGEYYFRPKPAMSRLDFVLFLNAVLGIAPDTSKTSLFADITEEWMIGPLNAAQKKNITSGSVVDGQTVFDPDKTLTRIEAAVFLAKALNLPASSAADLPYSDSAMVPSWGVQYLKDLTGYDIISGGTDGSFRPMSPVSRAEAASMLYKAYKEQLLQLSANAIAGQ